MKSKLIKIIVVLVMLLLSIIGYKLIRDINIIPSKYLNFLLILVLILNLLGILLIIPKIKLTKVFCIIIYIMTGIISIISIIVSVNANKYLNKLFNNVKEITVYNVITLKENEYNKIQDLNNNSTIGYLSTSIDEHKYLDTLKEKVNTRLEEYNILELYNNLFSKRIDAIVINEAYLDLLEEQFQEFGDKIKIIYSFNIEEKVESKNENVSKLKPLNIYISGSDSRNEHITANSLSDVNIIITINPNTHKILLTTTPRDFYVNLHGTTGIRDKLTHAGLYGLDMSCKTIEDIYGIDIDYSVKVGFNGVIEVVDLIDGIDINSDSAFRCYTNSKVYVKKGTNHFNGVQALAYSRERMAYSDGDQHRGRNQQQVMEAVFTKVLSDKSLLLKVDKLLDTLDNLYITDIPRDVVTLFLKDQLDKIPSWKIESQEVGGFQSSGETYSMPGIVLYVTEPNYKTVQTAITKIKNVYQGK